MKETRITARTWARFHLVLTFVWAAAIIPSVLWWSESVPWLVALSVWANIAGHFGAYQASRGEQRIHE